ncbi:MAG: nucleotide-binding protein [Bacteroidota bacterium]
MATKRRINIEPVKEADALTTGRADFKGMLLDRIDKGKLLLARPVTTIPDLEVLQTEFSKWNDYNVEYLKQSFNNESNQYRKHYEDAGSFSGLLGYQDNSPNARYARLREKIEIKITDIEKLVDKVDLLKSEIGENKIKEEIKNQKTDLEAVFIVHGHNVAIQQSVARIIERLGLKPIILHEQANSGRTIIEKFETHSDVGFAIVLLTDDDEGKAKTEVDLKKRARQNVVMELGYFIGKLGRSRVLPLHSDGVELPSDIHGLLYIPIDNADNWKFSIVKELKEAGYEVDANKLL